MQRPSSTLLDGLNSCMLMIADFFGGIIIGAGYEKGTSPPAAQTPGKNEAPKQDNLQSEPHLRLSPISSRCPSAVLKRDRDAEDAAKIARLSQDVDWGYTLQLPKRLQQKVTAQLHREWD